MGYKVTKKKHGIEVDGAVPIKELWALAEIWQEDGWTFLDGNFAADLGVTFVVTNEVARRTWYAEHDLNRPSV